MESTAAGWPAPGPPDAGARVLTMAGYCVQIRPIRPSDRARIAAVFSELTERSRYQRFLGVRRELSPSQLVYFTDVDHHDHEALVANDLTTGVTLAVARYIRAPEAPHTAEVAVVVLDRCQHTGIGAALIDDLAARARHVGVQRFTAEVLVPNPGMFALLGRLGDLHTQQDGDTAVATVSLRAAQHSPHRHPDDSNSRSLTGTVPGRWTTTHHRPRRATGVAVTPEDALAAGLAAVADTELAVR